jgi:hypothetical protein
MGVDRPSQLLQIAANAGVVLSITSLGSELRQNGDMMRAQTRNQLAHNVVNQLSSDERGVSPNLNTRPHSTRQPLAETEDLRIQSYRTGVFRNLQWM